MKLPIVKPAILEKILINIGFEKIRKKGSHAFYKHPDGRYTTIPHHKGRVISRPLLRKILREINITTDDFIKIYKNI
jgi:predicted RNA binding protein YcfA (HicA-like mRNA interferase family)